MVTCYPSYEMTPPLPSPAQCAEAVQGVQGERLGQAVQGGKDYSRPLHVDCSVEYELPDAAKPPAGQRSEPLLMIHPCYYRRAEAQRRTRFVNNLPKSLSSPVSSSSSASSSSASSVSSGRRSKVARLATSSSAVEPAWPQPKPVSLPVYPAPAGVPGPAGPPSCYKVGATADFSTSAWPGRTPAAPSSAKLDAGVLSDIIVSTCSELNNNNSSSSNNNYMKQQQQSQAPPASSQTQLGSCGAVPSYLPGYHPHHGLHHHAGAGASAGAHPAGHHHGHGPQQPQQQHQASQATQVNRLYGGGLVKAEAAPVPTKARRSGVKRSRSSRALQDCARATPSTWSDAMLHLNAFESAAAAAAAAAAAGAAAGVWYPHQGTPLSTPQHQHHHPHAPVPAPVPGATAADPLGAPLAPLGSVAWGAMFPHCREREDDSRVLWNSDSLLRLVPV